LSCGLSWRFQVTQNDVAGWLPAGGGRPPARHPAAVTDEDVAAAIIAVVGAVELAASMLYEHAQAKQE
jgi:hypothetical protein